MTDGKGTVSVLCAVYGAGACTHVLCNMKMCASCTLYVCNWHSHCHLVRNVVGLYSEAIHVWCQPVEELEDGWGLRIH